MEAHLGNYKEGEGPTSV